MPFQAEIGVHAFALCHTSNALPGLHDPVPAVGRSGYLPRARAGVATMRPPPAPLA